jgi:hypothetical protein
MSGTLTVPSKDPFGYYKNREAQKQQIISRNAEKLAQLGRAIEEESKFFQQNKGTIESSFNAKRVNVPAMILREGNGVEKRSEQKNSIFWSYSFLVWFGNLDGVTGEGSVCDKGILYLSLKDKDEKKDANANDARKKADTNTVKPSLPLQSFCKKYVSVITNTMSNELELLRPGDLVMLEDLSASISVSSKDGKTYTNLNARRIEKQMANAVPSQMYKLLLDVYGSNRFFSKPVTPSDPNAPIEDTPLEWFFVDNSYDYSVLEKKNASLIYQRIESDPKYWIKKQGDQDPGTPIMKSWLIAQQCKGEYIPENSERIVISAPIYGPAIFNCFGISDPAAWNSLGRHILRYLSFFIVGNINISKTIGNKYNQKKEMLEQEKLLGEQQETETDQEKEPEDDDFDLPTGDISSGVYAYGLCYTAYGIFADWAAHMSYYGIKVSAQFLMEEFRSYKMNPLLVRGLNTSEANFICLSEQEDPISLIRGQRSATKNMFRAIISFDFSEKQLQIISSMNEDQGKQLIQFLCTPSMTGVQKSLPKGHPLEGFQFQQNGDPLRVYYFLIKPSNTRPSPFLNRFLSGKKDATVIFDSVNRTIVAPSKPLALPEPSEKEQAAPKKKMVVSDAKEKKRDASDSENADLFDSLTAHQPSLDDLEENDLRNSKKRVRESDSESESAETTTKKPPTKGSKAAKGKGKK